MKSKESDDDDVEEEEEKREKTKKTKKLPQKKKNHKHREEAKDDDDDVTEGKIRTFGLNKKIKIINFLRSLKKKLFLTLNTIITMTNIRI